MDIFINCTNHPSSEWNKAQQLAASLYGEIVDIPFPTIDPSATEQERQRITYESCQEITKHAPTAVLCQGEMGVTFMMVDYLLQKGIPVLFACSKRKATETVLKDGSTQKSSQFSFHGFQNYQYSNRKTEIFF